MKGVSMLKLFKEASGGAVFAVLLAALLVGAGGCANTNTAQDKSRGASLLLVDSLQGIDGSGGGGTATTVLFSDVLTCAADGTGCHVVNDNGDVVLRNIPLNQGSDPATNGTSAYQDILMYRLTVQYTRGDGHNVQGIDIPYNFDSVMSGTVSIGATLDWIFVLVRHVAKEERPLVDLIGIGDERILYTNTRCDFFGRDIAGNEHQAYAWIEIEFGDFQQG